MTNLEEAREQAREALELIHTWAQREQAWDTPRALDFARIGASIRALLDATEPPAPLSVEDFITGTTDGEVDTDEFFADRDERPAEDEREALEALLASPVHAPQETHSRVDGSCSECPWPLSQLPYRDQAEAILAAGYSKGPRPVTDEMVKEARWAWHAADATTGPGTRMRAALEAAEGARR